jgi:hypothetical protein
MAARKHAAVPPLTTENVKDIIAQAVYAITLGAQGMELDMLRTQWGPRGQQLFDIALDGAKRGQEWAL